MAEPTRDDFESYRRLLSGSLSTIPSVGVPETPEQRLSESLESYDRAMAAGETMGIGQNFAQGATGLLSFLGGVLDTPRRFVMSAGKETADLLGGNTASFSDFRRQMSEGYGAGDTELLKFAQDDSSAERVLKGISAFVVDSALDPLSYVSFGTASMGKRGLVDMAGVAARDLGQSFIRKEFPEGTSEIVKRAAGFFDEKTIKRLSEDTTPDSIRKFLNDTMDEELIPLDRTKDDVVEELLRTRPTDVESLAIEGFTARVAGAFLKGGPIEVRRSLQEVFGKNGEEVFDALVARFPELGGGITARIPGVGSKTFTTSGRVLESLGLDDLALSVHRMRSYSRFKWRPTAAVSGALGGEFGDLYNKVVRDAFSDSNDLAKVGWTEYDAYRTLVKKRRSDRVGARLQLHQLLTQAAITIKGDDEAETYFKRSFLNPVAQRASTADEFERLVKAHSDEDLASLRSFVPEFGESQLSESAQKGILAAKFIHAEFRAAWERARANGVDVGFIENYVPRVMTDEYAKQRKSLQVRASRSGPGDDSPKASTRYAKRRRYFWGLSVVDDDIERVWSTVTKINENLGEVAFEDDPFTVAGLYLDAMWRLNSHVEFHKGMLSSGLLFKGDTRISNQVDFEAVEDDIKKLFGENAKDNIENVDAVLETFREIASTSDPALRESLFSSMVEVLGENKVLAEYLVAARKAGAGWTALVPTDVTNQGFTFKSLGNTQTGTVRMADDTLNAIGKIEIVETVQRLYDLEAKQMENWVNQIYRPMMGMFKTAATVGRGPGYHFRNVVSALWNNYIVGVSSSTQLQALEISNTVERIIKKHRTDTDGQFLLIPAKAAREIEDELSKIKFRTPAGTRSAYDVWMDFEQRGVASNNRVLESLTSEALPGLSGTVVGDIAQRGALGATRDTRSKAQKMADKFSETAWVRFNKRSAEKSEEVVRLGAFLHGVKKWGSGDVAEILVDNVQFNYLNLSPTEMKIRDYGLWFYSWTRNNVPLQFRALMSDPGKINAALRANAGLQELLEDEDNPYLNFVPEWERERMGFISKITSGGKNVVLGLDLPFMDLNRYFQVPTGGISANPLSYVDTREVLGQSNPFAQTAFEVIARKDVGTGFAIPDQVETPMPAVFKQLQRFTFLPFFGTNDAGNPTIPGTVDAVIRGLVPYVGQAENVLTPALEGATGIDFARERAEDRYGTTLYSNLFGSPITASTLSPRQLASEVRTQTTRTLDEFRRTATNQGVDPSWIRDMLRKTDDPEYVRYLLSEGYGQR